MYNTKVLLSKISFYGSCEQECSLSDLMLFSFAEIRNITKEDLTWGEAKYLYDQVQEERKRNKLAELEIISRSNPQLVNAVRLGIRQSKLQMGYENLFGRESIKFVEPGVVSSMFSPAAYLTEIYREAKPLHNADYRNSLDKRRPDLSELILNQENMDKEVSTLKLSNDIIINNIKNRENKETDAIFETLSTYRMTGNTPYNLPYESIRQTILLLDKDLSAFNLNPDLAENINYISLLAILSDVSPELYLILTEDITEANAKELFKKNFGDISVNSLLNIRTLSNYYDIQPKELSTLINSIQIEPQFSEPNEYYVNDTISLILSHPDDSLGEVVEITRTAGVNYHRVNYVELLPLGSQNYLMSLNFTDDTSGSFSIGTKGVLSSDLYYNPSIEITKNKEIRIPVTLTDDDLDSGLTIYLSRLGGAYQTTVSFNKTTSSPEAYALNLNKIIRTYRASELSSEQMSLIVNNKVQGKFFDDSMLFLMFYTKYYMLCYGLEAEKALVLGGGGISTTKINGHTSFFDLLFNSPELNGKRFECDGELINWDSCTENDIFRISILKRAFNVSESELQALWSLVSSNSESFSCTRENISALYQLILLAQIHNFSITELVMLMSISPWSQKPLMTLDEAEIIKLINFVSRIKNWISNLAWSISDLFVMLTTWYDVTITPEINNLFATIRNSFDAEESLPTPLIPNIAPYIAATMRLDSSDSAQAVLYWLDQIQPEGLDTESFINNIIDNNYSDEIERKLVIFCQVLSQLSLAIRNTSISSQELLVLVKHPDRYDVGLSSLPWNLDTLFSLNRFHSTINQTGEYASKILTALAQGELNLTLLSEALTLEKEDLSQALVLAGGLDDLFLSWKQVDIALQWMDMAKTLSCSPSSVGKLVSMNYINVTKENQPLYADWLQLSNLMQAGLNKDNTIVLHDLLDESLSTALCSYFIKTVENPEVTDREALYSWLLIDNKVSGKVKTTQISEAISSVQLYVNRVLNGLEYNINYSVRSRQFFKDWDKYNKRYSTWSGISELVYYPENYIDPTVRLGQTDMMDEMLQKIGQSELSSDVVEDAFKGYMASFEAIANLDVICAYHDNLSFTQGTSWFLGRSIVDGEKYYWRTLNQSMFYNNSYPANAWSEWEEIGTAIKAYDDKVRPVVFNSRLYVFWVEEQIIASTDDNNTVFENSVFVLKHAYKKHDNSWSVPITNSLSNVLKDSTDTLSKMRMYCVNEDDNNFLVLFYIPQSSEDGNKNTVCYGMSISIENVVSILSDIDMNSYIQYIYTDFDTIDTHRICKYFSKSAYSTGLHFKWKYNIASDNGSLNVRGGTLELNSLSYNSNDNTVDLAFNARLRFIPAFNTEHSYVAEIIEKYSQEGDVFYFGEMASDNTLSFTPVIRTRNATKELIVYCSASADINSMRLMLIDVSTPWDQIPIELTLDATVSHHSFYKGMVPSSFDTSETSTWGWYIEDDWSHYSFVLPPLYSYTIGTSPQNIRVEFVSGNEKYAFTADEYVPEDLMPSYNLNEMVYPFVSLNLSISDSEFVDNLLDVNVKFSAYNSAGASLGEQNGVFSISRVLVGEQKSISIVKDLSGVQYLKYGSSRTRINTLMARSLVALAELGLDSVLSMDAQNIQEPKPGPGSYVDVIFSKYSSKLHGEGWYELFLVGVDNNDDNGRATVVAASGYVSENFETTVRLFVPYNKEKTGSEKLLVFIGVRYSDYNSLGSYKTMQSFSYDANQDKFVASSENDSRTRGLRSRVSNDITEPMDFRGANALYFWEMFFYVPSMVFQRLLQEQRYDDATRWMKYIWNPDGYIGNNGEPASWTWNVRPLEEDTSWNTSPLDSVDPDAIAQADPMHYKVATFMRALDLLIARGDDCYRKLERDTLTEAKMWYCQALNILGPESDNIYFNDSWYNPSLSDAADLTSTVSYQNGMSLLRNLVLSQPSEKTANSVSSLFFPQQNEKLAGYWRTLEQRIYNLRHNLSIDGQPLMLPIYAKPADPKALLSAAVVSSDGGDELPSIDLSLYRFPVLIEMARNMVGQLMQFGSLMLNFTERQDGEALAELLQTQGSEMLLQAILIQDKNLEEIEADINALEENLKGAQVRFDNYSKLFEENISDGENQAMQLYLSSSIEATVATGFQMGAAALDLVPNIYGLAVGGSRYGALLNAFAYGATIASEATRFTADKISQSETYRRRREDWDILRKTAESDIKQINAQLASLAVRKEAAMLQKTSLEMQQTQSQAQLVFLQNKFTNQALYNWLRGKLSAIYYQFYDLTLSQCLLAQKSWQWFFNDNTTQFIRPGNWQSTYAGLMAGETLLLSLEKMEQAWLKKDERLLEVNRTVPLSLFYNELPEGASFNFEDSVSALVNSGKGTIGLNGNTLSVSDDGQLQVSFKLSDINITDDYPANLGESRRIKQISVTLPGLLGPYNDIKAILSYGGSVVLPRGCSSIAISHGMNDSGQFQLDFNDVRWLPFEGIPVGDTGILTISFPSLADKQKTFLLSLTDIIIHIRYTIGK